MKYVLLSALLVIGFLLTISGGGFTVAGFAVWIIAYFVELLYVKV